MKVDANVKAPEKRTFTFKMAADDAVYLLNLCLKNVTKMAYFNVSVASTVNKKSLHFSTNEN